MKKVIAIFTAMAFALTLGVAFAQETAPAAPEKKVEQKTPAKHKRHKAHKKVKKEAATSTAAPATK